MLEQILEILEQPKQPTIGLYAKTVVRMYTGPVFPPGTPYGMPSAWGPVEDYGWSGPGEACTLYPGMVGRFRPEHESGQEHGSEPHTHLDIHSILTNFNKPVQTIHTPTEDKDG